MHRQTKRNGKIMNKRVIQVKGIEWNKKGKELNLPINILFPQTKRMAHLLNITGNDSSFVIDFLNEITPSGCNAICFDDFSRIQYTETLSLEIPKLSGFDSWESFYKFIY